jgi:AraC-like DNA-binding protein
VAYIRDHFAEDLSRAKVARVAGFAEHYFSRRFAEVEGSTFQTYLNGLRLKRAKEMLLTTSLSVERVGQLCGFPTRTQFHKAFKRFMAKTPDEFRAARALAPGS